MTFDRRILRSTEDVFQHGKIQPQAVDLEEAVLGAMLLEPQACRLAMAIIKSPDIFYKDQHKIIYKAIASLYADNHPVDILTVTEQLKKTGELEASGGAYYVSVLTNNVSSSANTEYHIAIILQKWLRREMIRLFSEGIKESFEDSDDVFEALDRYSIGLIDLYNTLNVSSVQSVGDIARENLHAIINANGEEVIGIPTGFVVVDKLINGFQKGDLIIIAGRPGMGKTAFGVSVVVNTSIGFNIPSGIISLEMTKAQLVMRIQTILSGIQYQDLKGGRIDAYQKNKVTEETNHLVNAPIYIDDTPSLSLIQVRAKALDMVKRFGVKILFVDYLQLMSGSGKRGQNREQEVSEISRGLKALAKELDIPVVAFSQLSRKVEERGGDKKPKLSDLRESGAIEQDADLVIFLYRPEYYGIYEDEEGNSTLDTGVVIVEKHRNGSLGERRLMFKKQLMRFMDFETQGVSYNQTSLKSFFDDEISSEPEINAPF